MREGYKKTEVGIIPEDWEVKKIGVISEVKTGGTPSRKNEHYWKDGKIPWMSSGEVNNKIIYSTKEYITELGLKNSNTELLPKGTIMMALNGQGKTRGKVALLQIETTCNQSLAGIIPNQSVNEKYVYFYLDSLYDNIRALTGDGARNGLNLSLIRDLKISIPPLREQEKIAEILSTVDSQIDDTEKLIEKSKELKKGLMQKLLTRGIGHSEFKKTEVGEIPASWEVNKLSNITDVRDGTHDSPQYVETGIPFVTSKNLKEFGIDFSDVNYISNEDHEKFSKRSLVDNGDILFGMIGTIGNPVLVKKTFDFSIKNVALIKIDNNLINNTYLLNILKSSIIEKQFSKLSNGGVQKFISLGMIRNLLIPIPSKKEQEKIAEILSLLDNDIQEYENRKQKLEELKKGLMQQLLTGKIRTV